MVGVQVGCHAQGVDVLHLDASTDGLDHVVSFELTEHANQTLRRGPNDVGNLLSREWHFESFTIVVGTKGRPQHQESLGNTLPNRLLRKLYDASLGVLQFMAHDLQHTKAKVRIIPKVPVDVLVWDKAHSRRLYGYRRDRVGLCGNHRSVANGVPSTRKSDNLLTTITTVPYKFHMAVVDTVKTSWILAFRKHGFSTLDVLTALRSCDFRELYGF